MKTFYKHAATLLAAIVSFSPHCLSSETEPASMDTIPAEDIEKTLTSNEFATTDDEQLPVDPSNTLIDFTEYIQFDEILTPDSTANTGRMSIYALPYSMTRSVPDWRRMWTNTAVLSGAFVGTLLVLECLPEDATTWNRAELQKVPMFKRWWEHVVEKGPEWDHDNPVFNFVLHPYAGAAYFMSARSCGFNFYQSLLYSTIVSTVGWEFGIEAFMERPSIQDLFITPLVGSAIGEGFYHIKRHIVDHGYRLWGSPVIGNIVAFVIDPVNEVIGLFGGNEARRVAKAKSVNIASSWNVSPHSLALNVNITF